MFTHSTTHKRKNYVFEENVCKIKKVETTALTYEKVSNLFHLPITIACLSLDVEVDTLIQACREFGIKRWPYNARKELNKGKKQDKKKGTIPIDKNMFLEFKVEGPITVQPALTSQLPSFKEFISTLK